MMIKIYLDFIIMENQPEPFTEEAKLQLKAEIVERFKNFAALDEFNLIDDMIEEYSKDRDYFKKLTASNIQEKKDKLETAEQIQTVKAGTPEWQEIIDKMDAAKKEAAYQIEDDDGIETVSIETNNSENAKDNEANVEVLADEKDWVDTKYELQETALISNDTLYDDTSTHTISSTQHNETQPSQDS